VYIQIFLTYLKAEDDSDFLVDPPNVDEKLGALSFSFFSFRSFLNNVFATELVQGIGVSAYGYYHQLSLQQQSIFLRELISNASDVSIH
jgi:hypothetical protein